MRTEPVVTLEDVMAATRCVVSLVRTGRCETPVEAAWILRNRARAAIEDRRRGAAPSRGFGDGSLSGAAASLMREAAMRPVGLSRPRMLLAGAAVCGVLSDGAPDPTGGAVRPAGSVVQDGAPPRETRP